MRFESHVVFFFQIVTRFYGILHKCYLTHHDTTDEAVMLRRRAKAAFKGKL